jgi:hypothetical protein
MKNKFESYDWKYTQAIDEFKATGGTVIQSKPNLILLDLDDEASVVHYETHLPLIQERFNLLELSRYKSQSGIGTHVILHSDTLEFLQRILIQSVLGSDRKREALALLMFNDGIKNPSWLFRPKQ